MRKEELETITEKALEETGFTLITLRRVVALNRANNTWSILLWLKGKIPQSIVVRLDPLSTPQSVKEEIKETLRKIKPAWEKLI